MKPWQDPEHPSNRIRPKVKCLSCGKLGCVTAWGKWCFKCNVERMTRISASMDDLARGLGYKSADEVPK